MTSVLKVDNIQNSSGTSAITIDSSGNLTAPQRFSSKLVFAHAHATSDQSIASTTSTVIALDTAYSDRFNFADLTNNRLTVPTGLGGFYYIECSVRMSNFTAPRNSVLVRRNTNTLFATETVVGSSGSGEYGWVKGNFIHELDAGDNIDFTFYHNYGSTQTLYSGANSVDYRFHTYLQLLRLGD